jgi:hypothetical protein
MPSIVIIEKTGVVKDQIVKNIKKEELYKKAGFKNANGFSLQTTWDVMLGSKRYLIELYGKVDGIARQENKYEFPPPVDNVLYFGNCVLIHINEKEEIVDLDRKEWKQIYEVLYGGFEDLDDDEETSVDDIEGLELTKSGYEKDGFIVDDEELECDSDYHDEASSEEEVISKKKKIVKTPKKNSVKTTTSSKKSKTTTSKVELTETNENQEKKSYLNCDSELCEEKYI